MPNSQNGWPVVPNTATGLARLDREPLIRDVTIPNGMLAGDVAYVFRWLARQYDRRVERLRPGWCWGWFVKTIEGSQTISNHASGTALDFNAPDNPMGQGTTAKSMTPGQIAECHAIEEESGGVLRWGGDFSRNDPMHWEIVKNAGAVSALAEKIRREEQNMTDSDWRKDDINPDPNVTSTAGGAAWTILNRTGILNQLPGQITDLQEYLNDRVDDVDDVLDAQSAALVLINAKLDVLLQRIEPPTS